MLQVGNEFEEGGEASCYDKGVMSKFKNLYLKFKSYVTPLGFMMVFLCVHLGFLHIAKKHN